MASDKLTRTEPDIDELERLANAIPHGEWEAQPIEEEGPERGSACITAVWDGLVAAALPYPSELDRGDFTRVQAHAAFIAAANPAAILSLIASLRAATKAWSHLAGSAQAFLAHFNPFDMPEDKSQQWLSVYDQIHTFGLSATQPVAPVVENRLKSADAKLAEAERRANTLSLERASASIKLGEAERQIAALREGLERIGRWYGEFPETGKFWDDEKQRPMSYGAAFGSNGERDFMRGIARAALLSSPAPDQPSDNRAQGKKIADPKVQVIDIFEKHGLPYLGRANKAVDDIVRLLITVSPPPRPEPQEAKPAADPVDDLVSRNEVLRICRELGEQSADLALYGAPENARNRESMEAAATRIRCAIGLMPAATPPTEGEPQPVAWVNYTELKLLNRPGIGRVWAYAVRNGSYDTPLYASPPPLPEPQEAKPAASVSEEMVDAAYTALAGFAWDASDSGSYRVTRKGMRHALETALKRSTPPTEGEPQPVTWQAAEIVANMITEIDATIPDRLKQKGARFVEVEDTLHALHLSDIKLLREVEKRIRALPSSPPAAGSIPAGMVAISREIVEEVRTAKAVSAKSGTHSDWVLFQNAVRTLMEAALASSPSPAAEKGEG